jgi:hypothetical protein
LGVTVRVATIGAMTALCAACASRPQDFNKPSCIDTTMGGMVCIRVIGTGTHVNEIDTAYLAPTGPCRKGFFTMYTVQTLRSDPEYRTSGGDPKACYSDDKPGIQVFHPPGRDLSNNEQVCAQFNPDGVRSACINMPSG